MAAQFIHLFLYHSMRLRWWLAGVVAVSCLLLFVSDRVLDDRRADPYIHRFSSFLSPPAPLFTVRPPSRPAAARQYAVSTLISLTPTFCRLAYVMYRSLRRVDPNQRYDFVIMYHQSANVSLLTTDDYCAELVRWSPQVVWFGVDDRIQLLLNQSWMTIGHQEWRFSMNRMAILGADQYEKVLYIDADTLLYRDIDDFFRLPYDIAGGPDQWNACEHSAKMNGGLMLVAPSRYLYQTFESMLSGNTMKSCISGILFESDQELLNCMCGYGGAGYARVPELHCQMLPYFSSVMPQTVQCSHYNPDDLIMVHYSGPLKPWQGWKEAPRCDRWAQLATHNQTRGWFEAAERRHCFEAETALFTLWLCHHQHGYIDPLMAQENMPDCKLLHLHSTPGHRGVLYLPFESDWD
jgi:hypothetical protein